MQISMQLSMHKSIPPYANKANNRSAFESRKSGIGDFDRREGSMENLLQKLVLGSSAIALFAAVPFAPAFAQDSGDIEQVVVSASRITIAGYTAPTPVTV